MPQLLLKQNHFMVIQGKTTPLFIYHQSVSECEGGGGTSSTQDIDAQLLIPSFHSDFKLDTKSRRSKHQVVRFWNIIRLIRSTWIRTDNAMQRTDNYGATMVMLDKFELLLFLLPKQLCYRKASNHSRYEVWYLLYDNSSLPTSHGNRFLGWLAYCVTE